MGGGGRGIWLIFLCIDFYDRNLHKIAGVAKFSIELHKMASYMGNLYLYFQCVLCFLSHFQCVLHVFFSSEIYVFFAKKRITFRDES